MLSFVLSFILRHLYYQATKNVSLITINVYTLEIRAPVCISLVTGPIFPSIPPPLIHTGAVELGLSQPDIDVIMDTTEPLREGMAVPGVWLIGF